jgi:hypothetical protein
MNKASVVRVIKGGPCNILITIVKLSNQFENPYSKTEI